MPQLIRNGAISCIDELFSPWPKKLIEFRIGTTERILCRIQITVKINRIAVKEATANYTRVFNVYFVARSGWPTALCVVHPKDRVLVDTSSTGIVHAVSVPRKRTTPDNHFRTRKQRKSSRTVLRLPFTDLRRFAHPEGRLTCYPTNRQFSMTAELPHNKSTAEPVTGQRLLRKIQFLSSTEPSM